MRDAIAKACAEWAKVNEQYSLMMAGADADFAEGMSSVTEAALLGSEAPFVAIGTLVIGSILEAEAHHALVSIFSAWRESRLACICADLTAAIARCATGGCHIICRGKK